MAAVQRGTGAGGAASAASRLRLADAAVDRLLLPQTGNRSPQMFDHNKLEALRQKYRDARETEVAPERFRAPLNHILGAAYRRPMPYAGIPTLLDEPYRPEAAELPDFAGLDVALIGVPMDLGVTNRPGARFGPRALRAIERIGPYHHTLQVAPSTMCRLADVGDVPFSGRFSLESALTDIETFFAKVHQAGVRPLAVGGDHSITYPILKALGAKRPVGMVHFDAHCDTGGAFDGSKFHHGGPFRLAVLDGVLDPRRSIQIGIRGSSEYLWEFSRDAGMTVVPMQDFTALGSAGVIR